MPAAYKVLGQSSPGANAETALYTVPAGGQTVISTLTICNSGAAAATFTIRISPAGAASAPVHNIYAACPIDHNQTVVLTGGFTLSAGDIIRVNPSAAGISFHAYGMETTP
jgi:hypothetical protein